MKKTLLIAAAALAAGVISSQAQVYSQNVVGYVNVVNPANSFNLVANQLNFVGPNGTNAVNDVLVTGNFVSGGSTGTPIPQQSQLFSWNGGGYNQYYYYSAADLQALNGGTYYGPSGWYDSGFALVTATLNQGSGSFIYNPSATAITNTFVGTVVQGTVTNHIVNGFNLISVVAPLAGLALDNTNVNFPSYGDNASETYYHWNGNGYDNLYYYSAAYLFSIDPTYVADGYTPGWYDTGGANHSTTVNDPLWQNVGQASFVLYPGPATNWVSTFNVQ